MAVEDSNRTSRTALVLWRAPDTTAAGLQASGMRVGGRKVMSLYDPSFELGSPGKSSPNEDRYRSRFVELD